MKMKVNLTVLLIISLWLTSCLTRSDLPVQHVKDLNNSLNATAYILVEGRGSGTGFHIGDGYYITAAHVVYSEEPLVERKVLVDGFPAVLLKVDNDKDLALLRCPQLINEKSFKFNTSHLSVFDEVIALGYHFGIQMSITVGQVSYEDRSSDYITSTVPINAGCSGGPLVNSKFEVVGINLAILTRSGGWNGVSRSLKASEIVKFIKEYHEPKNIKK